MRARARASARSLPPVRQAPSEAVALAAAEERGAYKRKLQALLDDLDAENDAIRGTIEVTRAGLASTSSRICTLYGGAGQLARVA